MFELLKTPDYVSLANLVLGTLAVILALCGSDEPPLLSIVAALLLLAAVADGADGWVARKTAGGPLGEHIDSLADVLSFGIAPAVLLVSFCKADAPDTIIVVAAAIVACFYVVCGVLRLARYNAFHASVPQGYQGIPITAACVAMAVFTMFCDKAPVPHASVVLLVAMCLLSVLMVGSVPYSKVMKTRTFLFLIFIFALTVLSAPFVGICAAVAPGILSLLMILYLCFPIIGAVFRKRVSEL